MDYCVRIVNYSYSNIIKLLNFFYERLAFVKFLSLL